MTTLEFSAMACDKRLQKVLSVASPFPNKRIEKIIGKVFYSEWRASFSVTMGKSLSDIVNNNLYEYIRGGNRVEVIGSIHDTPELTNQAATPHAEPIEAGTRRGENI